MAKSVHPKKKRITHIANLSDSNLESDTGSVLLGCFDYVDIIMKEMDSGMKSVDCNKFCRQDADTMNLKAQKNKEHNLNVPNSNDSSQKLKNADSKFKKLSATRKFPLMEKSQKVLKQLKHNRSIPKQRAHLASIPASPVKKIRYSSELFQRKGNRNTEQRKKAKQKELPKKIACSKKTAICAQNSETFLKREVSEYCSVEHSDIQNKIKGNAKKKSNVQHSGIKERFKSSACNELHSIDKKMHANTYQKIDSEIQLNIDQETHDSHSIEKTSSTKDDDTSDSEYERFIQNNKSESHCKTTKKPKKKSAKKRKVLKKNPKRTKQVESESDQSNSSVTKKKEMQTESIFQSEQCETNYTVDSSDSARNISSKSKNNYKLTNYESETNLSMPKRVLETETFQFEQYDLNCTDSSSDSDYAENILKKQNYNPEISTESINESEINVNISKEEQKRIIETESMFPPDQYRSNCKNDFSDYAQNLLKKENKLETMKSFEFTNESGKNLSENSRISVSSQETVNAVVYQVGESTMQNDCTVLKKNDLNMPSECRNLCLQELDVPVEHEDIVKQDSVTYIKHSNDSKNVDVVNVEPSMNESHLEKQNINSTSSDILNQTVNHTNYNEYKSSENLVLIDLSSSDTETEDIKSFTSSATPIVENSKIVDLQNIATNSEDSDLEVIEVISVPNRNKKVYTCNTLINAGDCLKHIDLNENAKVENTVKGSPETKYSQFVNTNEKHIKKEKVQNHSAVFKTNICKDELLNSSPGYCKSETSFPRSNFVNSAVLCEDDIMIIDPEVQIKKEICDDDVIIDAVVYKCQNSNMKPIISVINSVSQSENFCAAVKKELNPMTMLTSSLSHLENLQRNISQVNRSESTNVQNTNCFKQLESDIKNESSTICTKSSFIKKELQNSSTSSVELKELHNIAHDNSAVLQLLDIYKREFNVYKEIVRTEENVEVGLKLVEAHQAEKLKSIRSLIQKIVKNDQSFNNIYSESLLNSKEKNLHDTVQSSTQNKVQPPECHDIDASKNSQVCIPQDSSTMVSSDVSSSIQDIPCISSTAIKTEVPDEKPDVSKLVNLQIQQTNQCFKSEIGFMLNASSTTTCSDLQHEEKQEMKLFGKKCDVCGKEAVAACQGCAKAFFCSHKCGKKYWNDGHENVCSK